MGTIPHSGSRGRQCERQQGPRRIGHEDQTSHLQSLRPLPKKIGLLSAGCFTGELYQPPKLLSILFRPLSRQRRPKIPLLVKAGLFPQEAVPEPRKEEIFTLPQPEHIRLLSHGLRARWRRFFKRRRGRLFPEDRGGGKSSEERMERSEEEQDQGRKRK